MHSIAQSRLLALRDNLKALVTPARTENDLAAIPFLCESLIENAIPMSSANRVMLEGELLRIEWALTRVAAGTYGLCFRCRSALDAERLRVDPAATFCAACLRLLASKTRQTSRDPSSSSRTKEIPSE